MKRVGATFWQRWVIGAVTVVLLALLLWFLGPVVGLSPMGRLVGLLVLAIAWAMLVTWRSAMTQRRGAALAGDVTAQADAPIVMRDGGRNDPAAAREVRERFDRALGLLRAHGRSRNLYELPWYVLIGAPGSGKSTALLNAGLEFPLATTETGPGALQGIGGTRNCEWYVTDSAILLDTAGRFITQDSDRAADSADWRSFLSLLRKHRRRRPINGVLLTVSIPDLVRVNDDERELHAAALRNRLREIQDELGIPFPVYVLLTKADLIAGFDDFFADLHTRAARAQVLGVTFPLAASSRGRAVGLIAEEMNVLAARMQERVIFRLADERDSLRRANIAAFPAQLAGLGPTLERFLGEVFKTAEADTMWLRGYYFTSGTQEGAPIDRLLAAMSDTFGVELRVPRPAAKRGTSFFLETLLTKVVFQEAGLAGVNERMQWQLAAARITAYALIALAFTAGVAALVISYRANGEFIASLERLEQRAIGWDVASTEPIEFEEALARLDALALLWKGANRNREPVPLHMRWGLFQGDTLGLAADDGYRLALNAALGPWVSGHFAEQIRAAGSEPQRLYNFLKAYLLLGTPARIEAGDNRAQLQSLGSLEWNRVFGDQSTRGEQLSAHYLEWTDGRVAAVDVDEHLIEQARVSLAQASLPALMYGQLRLAHATPSENDIHLERELVLGADAVLVRRSGRPLSDPLPALYTKSTFERFALEGRATLVQQFVVEDGWVFGERAPPLTQAPEVFAQLLALYEEDYIRAWESMLSDLTLRPFRDSNDALAVLGALGAPTSPLKNLALIVARHTNFSMPSPSAADTAVKASAGAVDALSRAAGLPGGTKPGARITAHFAAMHRLTEGPANGAPIDRTLAELMRIEQELRRVVDDDRGGAASVIQILRAIDSVTLQLPPSLGGIIEEGGVKIGQVTAGDARVELANRYAAQVVRECADLIANRYPAKRSATTDVALADFARVYGPNGVLDSFFQTQLAQYVDVTRPTWRWKAELKAMAGVPLSVFQDADRIRQAFFASGSATPALQFTMVPDYLDADVDRFTLNIDGQLLDYSHGPPRPIAISWPGVVPSGVSFVFEDPASGRQSRSFAGPWALFRLFDAARVEPQSDTRFLLSLSAGGRTARVLVTAASVRNPLAQPDLLRSRCGA